MRSLRLVLSRYLWLGALLATGGFSCRCADRSACAPLPGPLPNREVVAYQDTNYPIPDEVFANYDYGAITTLISTNSLAVCYAHAHGVRAVLYTLGPQPSNLRNRSALDALATTLVSRAVSDAFDGVNVDFEWPIAADDHASRVLRDAASPKARRGLPTLRAFGRSGVESERSGWAVLRLRRAAAPLRLRHRDGLRHAQPGVSAGNAPTGNECLHPQCSLSARRCPFNARAPPSPQRCILFLLPRTICVRCLS